MMAVKRGTGLLMVWTDVPGDREDEFNRWYNEEHIEDILGIPGVLNAARYEAVQGGPKHLACYELESPAAVLSDAFTKRRKSKWSETMGPAIVGQNMFNPLYEMIYPESVSSKMLESGMAPALGIGRMNSPQGREAEMDQWYSSTFLPEIEKVPGVIQVRRFKAVRGEDPAYSVVYELENEHVLQTPEWSARLGADPNNGAMLALNTQGPGSPGIWRKTFEL